MLILHPASLLLQAAVDDPNRFNGFLILGYLAMGAIGVAYLLYLQTRQRNAQKDLELLKKLLDDDQKLTKS